MPNFRYSGNDDEDICIGHYGEFDLFTSDSKEYFGIKWDHALDSEVVISTFNHKTWEDVCMTNPPPLRYPNRKAALKACWDLMYQKDPSVSPNA